MQIKKRKKLEKLEGGVKLLCICIVKIYKNFKY